jgi:hypothetical protein
VSPLFSADRKEIYVAESYYSRGVRGDRSDVVTVYDGRTLQPVHEIPIPAEAGEYFPGNAPNALSGRRPLHGGLQPDADDVAVHRRRARAPLRREVQTPGLQPGLRGRARAAFSCCARTAARSW